MALTVKKRNFADALMGGLSNRDAAIKAGYSAATASQQGSKLAKDPDVVRYMDDIQGGAVKATVKIKGGERDPKTVLIALMEDADPKIALKAATALMPFMYPRISSSAPVGKKETAKNDAVKKSAEGRFSTLSNQTALVESSKIQ